MIRVLRYGTRESHSRTFYVISQELFEVRELLSSALGRGLLVVSQRGSVPSKWFLPTSTQLCPGYTRMSSSVIRGWFCCCLLDPRTSLPCTQPDFDNIANRLRTISQRTCDCTG